MGTNHHIVWLLLYLLLKMEVLQSIRSNPVPMARSCCVVGCDARSQGRRSKKYTGLSFHCFPAWKQNQGDYMSELTKTRRMAWISAVNRVDLTFDNVSRSFKVCSRHFHSGKYIQFAQEKSMCLNMCSVPRRRSWGFFATMSTVFSQTLSSYRRFNQRRHITTSI